MTVDPVTELETEYDPDGDGPLSPIKFKIRIPDSDWVKVSIGWVLGLLTALGYLIFK